MKQRNLTMYRSVLWNVALAGGLLMLCGCNAEDIDRVTVSGTVNLDGAPLADGYITLTPQGAGPSAGAEIVDGRFVFPLAGGPSPGSYKVGIVSYQPTGRQIADMDNPGQMTDELKAVIPDRYNKASELEIVVAAEGENKLSFDLHSK